MGVRYIHLRLVEDPYDMFGNCALKARGGVTIAYGTLTKKDETKGRCYTFSVCSPKDNYNRSRGRVAAAVNGINGVIFFAPTTKGNDMVRSEDARIGIMRHLFTEAGIRKPFWLLAEHDLDSVDLKKLRRFLGETKGTL